MRYLSASHVGGLAALSLAAAQPAFGVNQSIDGNLLLYTTTQPPAWSPGTESFSSPKISARDFYDDLRFSLGYYPNMYTVGATVLNLNMARIVADGDGILSIQSGATPYGEIQMNPAPGQGVILYGAPDPWGYYSWRSEGAWKFVGGYIVANSTNYSELGLSLYYDPVAAVHKGAVNFNEGEGSLSMQTGGAVVVESGHSSVALELEGTKGLKSQSTANAGKFPRGDGTWQTLVGAGGGTFSGGVAVANDSPTSGGLSLGSGAAADGANLRLLSAAGQPQWNLDNFSGGLRFFTETAPGAGGSVKMTLNPAGYLGIGAPAPSARLDVANSDNTPALSVKSTHATPSTSVAVFQRSSPVPVANQTPGNALVAIKEAGGYPLAVTNASGSVSHLLVDNNGRVGVGTSVLQKKFQVAGTTSLQGDTEITGGLSVDGYASLGVVRSSFFELGLSGFIEGINDPMNPELWVGAGHTLSLAGFGINLLSQRIALGIDYGYQPTIEVSAGADWDTAQNIVLVPFGTGVVVHEGDTQLNGDVAVSGALTVNGLPIATANQLAPYQLSTGSGAGLTQLNAGALATGVVDVARLPATVTRLGASIELPSETTGNLDWTRVASRPTTLGGYGITNAVEKAADGGVALFGTLTIDGGDLVGADHFDAVSANIFSAFVDEFTAYSANLETAEAGTLTVNTLSFGANGMFIADGSASDPVITIQSGDSVNPGEIYVIGKVVVPDTSRMQVDGLLRVAPQGDIDMGVFQAEP